MGDERLNRTNLKLDETNVMMDIQNENIAKQNNWL